MRNIIKKLLKSRVVIWGVVPFLLSALWFGLTSLYIIHLDTAFSVLSYNEPLSSFTIFTRQKLLKGDIVAGNFIAEENNLGIVALRFQTFFRPDYQSEDKLLFQIKEKGAKRWYYQNIYRDGLIYDMPYFPFGFPIIPNSKGKTYEFRITSLSGTSNNSVALSYRGQILSAKYKFSKIELLADKKSIVQLFFKKVENAVETTDVLFSSFIYALPLLFYVCILLLERVFREKFRKFFREIQSFGKNRIISYIFPKVRSEERIFILLFNIILLFAVFLDSLYLQLGNNVVYLLFIILWVSLQRFFEVQSKWSFVIGISMLFLPPIFLIFSLSATAEQLAVYSYLFLIIGFIQILFELKYTYKKK